MKFLKIQTKEIQEDNQTDTKMIVQNEKVSWHYDHPKSLIEIKSLDERDFSFSEFLEIILERETLRILREKNFVIALEIYLVIKNFIWEFYSFLVANFIIYCLGLLAKKIIPTGW